MIPLWPLPTSVSLAAMMLRPLSWVLRSELTHLQSQQHVAEALLRKRPGSSDNLSYTLVTRLDFLKWEFGPVCMFTNSVKRIMRSQQGVGEPLLSLGLKGMQRGSCCWNAEWDVGETFLGVWGLGRKAAYLWAYSEILMAFLLSHSGSQGVFFISPWRSASQGRTE